MIFRVLWPTTHALGRVQAWLAADFREGTILEKILIFPVWLVFRALFIALLTGLRGGRVIGFLIVALILALFCEGCMWWTERRR